MSSRIDNIIPRLAEAVETVMNPSVGHNDRLTAHKICEEFKESSPDCLPCGLVLAGKQFSPILRHFGLQLVEHCIKFRWHIMSQNDKDNLKKSSMELVDQGTHSLLEEELHIKDGVSRIMVELIKREWPQLWPSLLTELHDLCQHGETQTELVLMIFHRLVEDVVAFQNLPHQRRREVLQALTSQMTQLFHFFLTLLENNTTLYRKLSGSENELEKLKALAACRVSEAVLSTLTGFVDWVNMSHIVERDGRLLQLLCLLLSDSSLQLSAAECLLLIVSRKGKLEERKPLLVLFSEDAMATILNAAVAAEKSSRDEYYYLFLKRLCQVLTETGKQLCVLWGSTESVTQPPNFSTYLQALLAFSEHPSQMLGSYTQTLWSSLLRHESISEDPVLVSFIPHLVKSMTKTLLKVGFPSQNNSPSCEYARLDFDSDEEFNMFFARYKVDIAFTLRAATLLEPKITFNIAMEWLHEQLHKPVATGEGQDKSYCTFSSPSFLEWDALTVFLESVMSRLFISQKPKPEVQEGIDMLQRVLDYQTQDPLILSCLLSCVSALFPFLTYTPERLPVVLEKIFHAVVFNLFGQTKSTRSRAVKNVRQHACSVLVKICKQYPDLLFPVFDRLYDHIKHISKDPEQLSQMEKCILTEALILISNQFKDFNKQSSFIEEVLSPVKELWVSPEFTEAFSSPAKFMSYVGLDQPPVEPSSADTCGINRSHISYCINTILAVMKRTKWPDDMQVAQNGGFANGNQSNGGPILRNPATPHISQLLENLMSLIKTLSQLWLPEFLKLRHPDFAMAYDLQDNEKLQILGIPPPCNDSTETTTSKHPLERMQNFLSIIYENCFHILGNAGQCLGYEFYTAPGLVEYVLKSVIQQLHHIPDYRLRPIIRVFMKPFVQNCPKECQTTALLPILSTLCPYMLQRLSVKWNQINLRFEKSENGGEKEQEEAEVLEDQLTRQLSREYMELLGCVCYSRKSNMESSDDVTMEETDNSAAQSSQPSKDDSLSELGQQCMKTESLFPSILLCVYSGLSWNDTTACNKCVNLAWPLVKQLQSDDVMTHEAASHVFMSVLTALQVHGQHEGSQAMLLGLGLQLYEALRPSFPDLAKILLQITDVTHPLVQSFDDKILQSSPQKQHSEKKKKEAFKKLVSGIIGKNIGQQFKREVHYQNLPPMFRHRHKNPSVDDVEKSDIGLCQLFKPDPPLRK
ncbi:LOW QUALITY PROTEIN: exportin-5-like [Haliotis rubra]|uniref:LOW QUALITY PROTEIN: exportin-5-like n=1 Tax=Haliotis rubra TaxID=36100 RepID=UPI001EE5671A|nr:LOW QUALITY PROTEIN: exportin-5-like [Haliotis rubra]